MSFNPEGRNMKFPQIRGHFPFEGAQSTKFWLRVFQMEGAVAFVQSKINEKPERRMASVPIVNDFVVDPEKLILLYVMHLKVDALGLQDGIGMIFYTDKKNLNEVRERRDQLADDMM